MLSKEAFTRDLTKEAEYGELDQVYCRERELFSILEILSRKNAANVLLVGPSGVGKNRIVEGLAIAGAREETDGLLEGFRLLELDFGALSSGSSQMEERLLHLLRYIRKERDIILFVDNIHQVLGTSADMVGAMDFGRTLSPALARGDFSCIATTTPDKFHDLFKKYPNLRRYFEVIPVEPLSEADTFEILKHLKPEYEAHHKVKIDLVALREAIVLSEQHLPYKHLPGKAIEVLDAACARYRSKSAIRARKPGLLPDISLNMSNQVTLHDIRKVIERMASVPIDLLTVQDRWEETEGKLNVHVLGQSTAIAHATKSIRSAQESLSEGHHPEIVLLFIGPPGVGKRLLAERLSEVIFGNDKQVLLIDMSKFDNRTFTSMLLELPRRTNGSNTARPKHVHRIYVESVIIMSGIEKAKSENFKFIMPILEKALCTDGSGRIISLKNCFFIFTTNVPQAECRREVIQEHPEQWMVSLRQKIQPRFLNLVNDVVPFFPLSSEDKHTITKRKIRELNDELSKGGAQVRLHQSAQALLAEKGYSEKAGVRGLHKAIEKLVARPIRNLVKAGQVKEGVVVHVKGRENSIVLQGENKRELGESTF